VNIAVIGAAGNMGRWFTNYFIRNGHKVKVYDTRRSAAKCLAEEVGAIYAPTLERCVRGCDVIFLSIPVEITPQILKRIEKIIESGSLLVEIASLKRDVVPALKKLPKQITPLSLHPLFGPGLSDLKFGRMIVVEVNDLKHETELAKKLFPEAHFTGCGVDEHDRMIAYSLTLPYFLNLAFGLRIANLNIAKLRQYAGTTLSIQLDLLEAIIQSSRHLIPQLLALNPYSDKVIKRYLEVTKTLHQHLKKREGLAKILAKLERKLTSDPDYKKAYQNLYNLTEKKH